MTFGQRLQMLRKQKGLSQEELARLLYVTRQSVSLWENDKTMPGIDLLIKLSSLFNISTDELLGKSAEPPKPYAKAKILNDKKEIKSAMGYTNTTLINVFISLTLGFSMLTALLISMYYLIDTKSGNASADNSSAYSMLIYVFIFLFLTLTFAITKYISIFNAQKQMNNKSGYILFYDSYMTVFLGDNGDAKSIPYFQLKKIINGDRYIVFNTCYGEVYCLDKHKTEGYFDTVIQRLKSEKAYKNKYVLKPESKSKHNTKQLLRIKRISDILFVQSLFSLYYLLMVWGFLMNSKLQAPYLIYIPVIIPVCALITGIIFKAMHMQGIKLIVASSIMSALILLYSSTIFPMLSEIVPAMPMLTEEGFTQTVDQNGFSISDNTEQNNILGAEKYLTAKSSEKDYEIIYVSFATYSSTTKYYDESKDEFLSENSGVYSMQRNETINEEVFSISYGDNYLYIYHNENSVLQVTGNSEDKEEILGIIESINSVLVE